MIAEASASSRLDGETRVIDSEVRRSVSDEELLALHARTTPGEWSAAPEPECRDEKPQNQWWWVTGDKNWPPVADDYPLASNCTFIAAAHNELPLILREKASLAEQLEAANGIISALAQLLGAKIETLPAISERVHQLNEQIERHQRDVKQRLAPSPRGDAVSAPMTPREALEFLWSMTSPYVWQSEAHEVLLRTIEQHEGAKKVSEMVSDINAHGEFVTVEYRPQRRAEHWRDALRAALTKGNP